MCKSVCVCKFCMYVVGSQGQEKAFGLLELELHTFVSHLTWMLELDLGSPQEQQAVLVTEPPFQCL